MYWVEWAERGSFATSVFHALSAGSTAQPPTVGLDPPAGGGAPPLPHVDANVVSARPSTIWAASRVYTFFPRSRAPSRYRSGDAIPGVSRFPAVGGTPS